MGELSIEVTLHSVRESQPHSTLLRTLSWIEDDFKVGRGVAGIPSTELTYGSVILGQEGGRGLLIYPLMIQFNFGGFRISRKHVTFQLVIPSAHGMLTLPSSICFTVKFLV